MDKDPPRRDWWESEDGIDLWSVPHFLFGVLVAMLTAYFSLSVWFTYVLMLAAAILWEGFEKYVDIKESLQNKVVDVIMPGVGYPLTLYLLFLFPLSEYWFFSLGMFIFILYGWFILLGWRAHRRRTRTS